MPEIKETPLPGVGTRFDFTSHDGSRVGVVHHRSGRRELFLCQADDPDAVILNVSLDDADSRALVEVLGGSQVVEALDSLQQNVEGLAIDWLSVEVGSPYAHRTLGEAQIRSRTGVSVVAAIRDTQALPSPSPDFEFLPDDTLVVVGTPEGIKEVEHILASG